MPDERAGMPGPGGSNTESTWYRKQVEQIVHRLREVEGTLQSLSAGEVDAIVDPASATPILLSRAQDELLRSEARYKDLVARSPSIVCELTPDGTTVFANDAVRTVLGIGPAELVGRDWWSEVIASEQREAANRFLRALEEGDVSGRELPLRASDGTLRRIEWTSANRYAPGGKLQSVILFGLDVTARRIAGDAERQLAEERLARAEAEAANKAKTEFLAVMSHELRTPLNAIAGYTDLIDAGVRGPVTPAQHEDLERIRRAERQLLGLINDVMNFARLEAGTVRFEIQKVVVCDVLAMLTTLMQAQAAAKQVTYSIALCDSDVTVAADRDKLEQILLNLVSNAIKFTDIGGSITVACEQSGASVRIVVTDTGRGIPSDKLNTIFDPFVQVNKQFTRDQEGVGLGLSISRGLALGMQGDLTVESVLGAGARFTLTLSSG